MDRTVLYGTGYVRVVSTPVLPTVHVGCLRINNIDFASISPNVFVETLTSFGSICEELHIVVCGRNVQPAHITHALLTYAAEKGTRKVDIPVAAEDGYGITDQCFLVGSSKFLFLFQFLFLFLTNRNTRNL
ncbi:hypothetical protein AAVH_18873 [Aphelenchoides avenae]|nr:hypothetical protein AAVH_18873 [Aphelenchus avenae]